MKRILTLLLCAVLPAAAVSPVPREDLFRLGYAPPETVYGHRDALTLSPELRERVESLFDTARFEMSDLEAAAASRESELETLVSSGIPPVEEAEACLNALLEAEGAVKRLQLRTVLGINALLSREQRDQAIELAKRDAAAEAKVNAKAEQFKVVFESLGIEPTPALKERGDAIRLLIEAGKYEAALTSLEAVAAEVGIEDPTPDLLDFSQFDPGDTNLDTLKQRFEAVESRTKQVVKIPLLRQLVQARDELETAKAAEDAVAVGRILTWAEGVLP